VEMQGETPRYHHQLGKYSLLGESRNKAILRRQASLTGLFIM